MTTKQYRTALRVVSTMSMIGLVLPYLVFPTPARAVAAPTVSAPPFITMNEGGIIMFYVTASDQDGDAITALTASPLPTGASLTVGSPYLRGIFTWSLGFDQAGVYDVVFTATSGTPPLSGSTTTRIIVTDADRAPVVAAPETVEGAVGLLTTFTVNAADRDGDAITALSATPLPLGATFSANASNTSGTFSWVPSTGQVGNHSVTFTATNAGSGSSTTALTVTLGANEPPVISTFPTPTITWGDSTVLDFTVTDQDSDPLIVGFSQTLDNPPPTDPVYLETLSSTPGEFIGKLHWSPAPNAPDTTYISIGQVCATDGINDTVCNDYRIEVLAKAPPPPPNHPPVAVLDASPTSVCLGDPVTFDGSRSYDPDNNPIAGQIDFGDGSPPEDGMTADYYYSEAGQYLPVLQVRDDFGGSSGWVAGPTIDVSAPLAMDFHTHPFFEENLYPAIAPYDLADPLNPPKPVALYVGIQPPSGSFDPATIAFDTARSVLHYTDPSGNVQTVTNLELDTFWTGYDSANGILWVLIGIPASGLDAFYSSFTQHVSKTNLTLEGSLLGVPGCDRLTYTHTVTVVRNHPPVLAPIDPITIFRRPGMNSLREPVLDPDGDPYTLSADGSNLPGGEVYTPQQVGYFRWIPCLEYRVCLGTFTFTFTAEDSYGYRSVLPVQITVLNTPPRSRPDVMWQSNYCTGKPMLFGSRASYDRDTLGQLPESWSWNFDDGTTSERVGPFLFLERHAYWSAENYKPELTVWDNDGASDTKASPLAIKQTTEIPGAVPVRGSLKYTIGSGTAPIFAFTAGRSGVALDDLDLVESFSFQGFYGNLAPITLSGRNYARVPWSIADVAAVVGKKVEVQFRPQALDEMFKEIPPGTGLTDTFYLQVPLKDPHVCESLTIPFTLEVWRK